MKVTAAFCPECNVWIFSRCPRDCRDCPGKHIFIDGGFEHLRLGFTGKLPRTKDFNIRATKAELYIDWNEGVDKFGIIKRKRGHYQYKI